MTYYTTCCRCNQYYVEDKKHILEISEKYYCMICCKNDPDFFTDLFDILCYNSDIINIQKIIDYDIDLNIKDSEGNTLLHVACKYYSEAVEPLINKGVSIDIKNIMNKTPLYYACRYGEYDTIKNLVEYGANIDIIINKDDTPLHAACIYGGMKIVTYLIEQGAKLNIKNKRGYTPLHKFCVFFPQRNHTTLY